MSLCVLRSFSFCSSVCLLVRSVKPLMSVKTMARFAVRKAGRFYQTIPSTTRLTAMKWPNAPRHTSVWNTSWYPNTAGHGSGFLSA